MSAPALSFLILIIIAIALFFVWLIYSRRYQRASQETAFVRTGYGGQKVVMNGGALVFPVLHEIIPVNMNTMRLDIVRSNNQALQTKDRMRMDVQAEFYVRVRPTLEDIAIAAQTLGRRTMNPEDLKNLVEGKFVNALRAVAAEKNMDELHQNRGEFVRNVQEAVGDGLSKNGLELESVSLSGLDQTDRKYFNPQNAFDAEGLMLLTELIQTRAKQRNVIERDTEVAIRKKDLEAERQKLEISKEEEFARMEQDREIQIRRADQQTRIVSEQVEKERLSREAELAARQQIEKAQLEAERLVEEERILKDQQVREKEIARQRAIEAAETERDRYIRETKIQADQQIDLARIATERTLEEERLLKERFVTEKEIERAQIIEDLRIQKDLFVKEKEIASARAVEEAEVLQHRVTSEARILAEKELERLQVAAEREVEEERLVKEQSLQEKQILTKKVLEAAEVERQRLVQEARIAADLLIGQSRLQSEKDLEEERIGKDKYLQDLEINKMKTIETAEIERKKTVDLADLDRTIAVSEKSKEHTAVLSEVDKIRAQAARAEEQVITARQIEIAERQKAIEILAARQKAEREKISITEAADAKMKAAVSQAETVGIISSGEADKIRKIAEAEAEAELLKIKAAESRYQVDAEGTRALHEAENILDPGKSAARIRMSVIEHLAEIVRESVKPMESIDGIKIYQIEGLTPSGAGASGSGTDLPPGSQNLADQLINSALRYRGQAPLIDAVLKEVGIAGGDINGLTAPLREEDDEDSDQET